MDSGLTSAGAGLALLFLLRWAALDHARVVTRDALRTVLGAEARLDVRAESYGLLGAIGGNVRNLTVNASGLRLASFPLTATAAGGDHATIHRLAFRAHGPWVRGYHVGELDVELPYAALRGAPFGAAHTLQLVGETDGSARIVLSASDLRAFAARKFARIATIDEVWLQGGLLYVRGRSAGIPYLLSGELTVVSPRGVGITRAAIRLGGSWLPTGAGSTMLAAVNPVLDTESDLGLARVLNLTGVSIDADAVTVTARVAILPERKNPRSESEAR